MDITIVVPVLDERENIAPLCARIAAALAPLTPDYEIIFVDDGSGDGTSEALIEANAKNPRVRALILSRRFGHQAALTAGLDRAQGRAVVTMDGDLQHPPELIPELIRKWKEGFEVVQAVRRSAVPSLKELASRCFYWVFNKMSRVPLPPRSAEFRLLDQKVVSSLRLLRERSRLLRGLTAWTGYRVAQVEYAAESRAGGLTKFGAADMIALAADGIVSFSSLPLLAGVWAGIMLGLLTLCYVAYALYSRFVSHQVLPGWTSIAALIGIVGSVQLMVMGLIGIYAGKIYEEVKQRPLYLIRGAVGLAP